jgi:hypothetical protein
MARMSTERLNELLLEALRRRAGLVTPDEHAFKPWLPESYWREKAAAEVVANILSEHEQAMVQAALARKRREAEDEHYAKMSVEELIGDPPGMWQPQIDTGWGTRSVRPSPWNTKAPTPGSQQPHYHFQCCQCGLPITVDGYDHNHNRLCDLALMDPAVFENEDHDVYHTPKPWHGEEEDDDDQ